MITRWGESLPRKSVNECGAAEWAGLRRALYLVAIFKNIEWVVHTVLRAHAVHISQQIRQAGFLLYKEVTSADVEAETVSLPKDVWNLATSLDFLPHGEGIVKHPT